MQTLELAVRKYKEGAVSLFEASKSVGMHPHEFVSHMVENERVRAYC